MKKNSFYTLFNAHTAIMLAVCLVLLGLALTMIFSSHDHLGEFSKAEARQQGQAVASHFERTMAQPGADSTQLSLLVSSAKMINDLSYLVLTDSTGAITESINYLGARRANFILPNTIEDSEAAEYVYRFAYPVQWPTKGGGTLYLGFQRGGTDVGLQEDRRYFRMIGALLIVISMFLLGSIRRFHFVEVNMSRLKLARKELAIEKVTLESQVSQHREKEQELKQSEQRYRSLLESTMQSAFKDLEKQKASLEREVEEKTATQQKLRRTTRRLRALNSIERKIVDEESLESIVEHAVSELEGLLTADRVSVVQLDHAMENVSYMASAGMDMDFVRLNESIPMDQFRPFKKGLFVARNLAKMPELAPLEESALAQGITCYCRVTLTAGERLAGALNVGYRHGDVFDEEALKVIRDVADLLSIAFRQHAHNRERMQYQEELIAERDRAEEMARLKTAFLTNMTHEIRTPLSGIIGFAQVLDEELEDERKEFAVLIQEAAKRLMTTINSVLDLSRLQADKESFNLQKLDTGVIITETVKVLEPLAEKKGLPIELELQSGLVANLDRSALEAIMNNLVGNAIKFTEKGHVRIRTSQEDDHFLIAVSDTGIGISDSFLPHLFDEFRQEYMDADRLAEGSGLGLAITARIVDKLGGRIDVESEVGTGSTFLVRLPNKAKTEGSDRQPSARTGHHAGNGTSSVPA